MSRTSSSWPDTIVRISTRIRRYWNVDTFRAGASISPLWRPDVTIAVADLLP